MNTKILKLNKQRLQVLLKWITVILILVIYCLPSINSFAAVPRLISCQAKVKDAQGVPITGKRDVTFRIYDQETGGSAIWSETYVGLDLEKGMLNVMLGSTKPNGIDLLFDKPYFVSIQVGSDPELSPRQRLGTSGYAIRADKADTADKAITIEGRTSDPSSPTTGQMWLRTDL
jgi:hypothetical protein